MKSTARSENSETSAEAPPAPATGLDAIAEAAGVREDEPAGALAMSSADQIWEISPSRYIARVSQRTGEEILRSIDPTELLVSAHRDKHPIEVSAQILASRLITLTGKEELVRSGLRQINSAGMKLAEAIGGAVASPSIENATKRLLGVIERDTVFKFREPTHLSAREVRARIEKLQKDARAALKARGRRPRLHVLLTGATGFLGKEILHQAAGDRRVEHLVSVVRAEKIKDPKTGEVLKVLSPQQRGALLLKRLGITGAKAKKFRFIEGDIERPHLGVAQTELARLRKSLTHVIHCAASVSFDDTYENSYRANVIGSLNALAFSLDIQNAEGSQFINHIAIETSYIHGRRKSSIAQESELVFPKHFYNNYYELTKAMASIETDRAMIERGLRVAQLLPSIVIGHSCTGNNRGDTKVVNAPINAFGRSKEVMEKASRDMVGRARARMIAVVAGSFPGDPSAELNLVPVDRVVAGILAALTVPDAIGRRIHLATDNRIRSEDMVRITREELGVNVRLVDPTVFRTVTMPVMKTVLQKLNEPKLANALEKLGNIFGGYSEWGQPIHEVGNDVRFLGLPLQRPFTTHAFRMLCRHNKFVQEFGRVRDGDEISRREKLWDKAIEDIEFKTGRQAASIGPREFRHLLAEEIDLKTFKPKS